MTKIAVEEGVIFEGDKIVEILRWENLSSKFDFLAELSSKFSDNEKPILVGGSAVELYTRGISRSIDLDLIDEASVLVPLLLKLGFKKEGRHFHKSGVYVEILSKKLSGKSNIVRYKDAKIRVISVEDLIVDRLCACNFCNSVYDCEQARMLVSAYKKRLNVNYIKEGVASCGGISIEF